MSERLPYEESLKEQLDDLPVPDEEQSWQKMKLLLEENDDDRIIPPILLRNCMGWGFLLLTVLAVLWLIFRPEKWWAAKDTAVQEQKVKNQNKPVTTTNPGHPPADTTTRFPRKTGSTQGKDTTGINVLPQKQTAGNRTTVRIINNNDDQNNSIHQQDINKKTVIIRTSGIRGASTSRSKKSNDKQASNLKSKRKKVLTRSAPRLTDVPFIVQDRSDLPKINLQPVDTIQIALVKPDTLVNKDTSQSAIKPVDSAIITPRGDTVVSIPPLKNKKKFFFSAGFGFQQQLPIGGQKSSPYNLYGRKNSLADYLPSVYLRLHRQEKWQIHTEFRYGAPQNVKEVAYVQNSFVTFDSTGGPVTSYTITNTSRLKKTFYHQVPLSFDYYVLPGWSVGTGIMYSRFFSAVSEQEARRKNNNTQAETVTKQIVQESANTDSTSFFSKSQVHILFGTEYTWKRFSAGLRYAKGLQPFIRYADAGGQMKSEKNQSLNFFIRFRLWKEQQ